MNALNRFLWFALVVLGGAPSSLAITSHRLYASAAITKLQLNSSIPPDAGLFRREDDGRWTEFGPRIASTGLVVHPANPVVMMIPGADGVMRSGDGGRTWRKTTGWRVGDVYSVTFDLSQPDRVYAATAWGPLRSIDDGQTWQLAQAGLDKLYCQAILADRAAPGHVFLGAEDGLYLSTDSAQSWNRVVFPQATVLHLEQCQTQPALLLAGTHKRGAWLSRDGGVTWQSADSATANANVYATAIAPDDSTLLAIGGWNIGVRVSADGGVTWADRTAGLPVPQVFVVEFDPEVKGRLWASTFQEGIFYSDDLGRVWLPAGLEGGYGSDFIFVSPTPSVIAPSISVQPDDGALAEGGKVTFTVIANSAISPSHRWQVSLNDGVTWTDLPNSGAYEGATTGTLTVTPVTAEMNGYRYRAVVSNVAGNAVSSAAKLTVFHAPIAGTYFGAFASGGSWSLLVRGDNTATFLAQFPERHSALVAHSTVDITGAFTATGREILPQSAPTIGTTLTVRGQLTDTGVTGQIASLGMTFTAPREAGSGTAAFYQAPARDGGVGAVYSIAGGGGKIMILAVTAVLIESATGRLIGDQFAATTSSGAGISVAIHGTPQVIDATITPVGGVSPVLFAAEGAGASSSARLINLSVLHEAGPGLVMGFVVHGAGAKPMLLRAIGPTLGSLFHVPGAMLNPQLEAFRGSVHLASNQDWGGAAELRVRFAQVGAFSLPEDSRDAALALMVEDGGYSLRVSSQDNGGGLALVEAYDGETDATASRVVNFSVLTRVESVGGMTVGFFVSGSRLKRLLIRAAGPSLARFGIADFLPDPALTVYHSTSVFAANDNWAGTAALKSAFASVNAFAFSDDTGKDAALVVRIEPGDYSVTVAGNRGGAGSVIMEIYELPED